MTSVLIPAAGSSTSRLQSVDILRGFVMIVMAIDHVRVFSGVMPGGPTADVFFTRWITHFCAPVFAFLAGVGSYYYLQKSGDTRALARFLLTRGLLLVVLELTVIRFLWTFNVDIGDFVHTNIIWALGWSMVLLAACANLRPTTIGVAGLLLVACQQVLPYFPLLLPASLREPVAKFWSFLYPTPFAHQPTQEILPGFALPEVAGISILYVVLPWLGVMMTGYGFGTVLRMDSAVRRKLCQRIGLACICLFLGAGALMTWMDTSGSKAPFLFRLLGQQKYPPSQLYLLMTLGPAIVLIPWAEQWKGRAAQAVALIGRVPMFFYLAHLLFIHVSALAVNALLFGDMQQAWYARAPFVAVDPDLRWGLPLLYLVWIANQPPLYYACRWYAGYKVRHPEQAWLKYL